MSTPALDDLTFKYVAVNRAGKQVRDTVRARDPRAAARQLANEGLTPLSIVETKESAKRGQNRDFKFSERVAVLNQLALMVEAGVGLLDALSTAAAGVQANKGRLALEGTVAALKRGESFANALEQNAPGFPFYVYAMTRVGEATGAIGQVLRDAAEQMAYENKLRRDFVSSMTYPVLLITIGFTAVGFIFVQLVPKFKVMIEDTSTLPTVSRLVFGLSDFLNANLWGFLAALVAIVVTIVAVLSNKAVKKSVYTFFYNAPVTGPLFQAREINSWSRLLGFSLTHGVLLLDAAALARQGAADGPFKKTLDHFERELKAGVAVDASLARHTRLTAMDLSLIRAGQMSGALAKMFMFIADNYDSILRDRMKRATALIEPLTIVLIAAMVGTLAIGIVLALVSSYGQIG